MNKKAQDGMSKKLYDGETWRWTDEARSLAHEIHQAIQPIFDRYVSEGYSPREIAHVIGATANEQELSTVINKGIEVSKQKKKERELKRQLDNQADDGSVKQEATPTTE